MARDRRHFGTGFGSGADDFADEGPDPMATVANISDAMLVFACGLLLAIVTYWNLDLPQIQQVEQKNMTEVKDIEITQDEMTANGSSYTQRGTVYEDPETGTLYMLEEEK